MSNGTNLGPMGVDLNSLTDLPQDLRRRAADGLAALEAAVTQGDPDAAAKATQTLRDIIAEITELKAAANTTKLFAAAPRVSGSHDVMKFFAARAGVRA